MNKLNEEQRNEWRTTFRARALAYSEERNGVKAADRSVWDLGYDYGREVAERCFHDPAAYFDPSRKPREWSAAYWAGVKFGHDQREVELCWLEDNGSVVRGVA